MEELKREIETLKQEIAELKQNQGQLRIPIDNTTMSALNEAMRSFVFDGINVKNVYFETGKTQNPTVSGQMNYFDGASKGFRIHVNTFTGQLDATGI